MSDSEGLFEEKWYEPLELIPIIKMRPPSPVELQVLNQKFEDEDKLMINITS